jgi:hypothetical protein
MTQTPKPTRSAFSNLHPDEVLDAMLKESDRKQAEAGLSSDERQLVIQKRKKAQSKKEAARRKSQAQLANRLQLLLPTDLKEKIQKLAAELQIPQSQVVTFFLYEAFQSYEKGSIHFDGFLLPSKSPRYEYNLIHPSDSERALKNSKKRKNVSSDSK